MIPLTPSLLVAAANSFIGLGEQGGDNRGQMVELFLREVRQPPGQPWCAAFVHHVGYWSHYDHHVDLSSWPLPPTASCAELGEFAVRNRILEEAPEVGDVFLLQSRRLGRFAHTGIVTYVDWILDGREGSTYACTTIEGNTNDDGSVNGHNTLMKRRQFSKKNGDRFIRWKNLHANSQSAA